MWARDGAVALPKSKGGSNLRQVAPREFCPKPNNKILCILGLISDQSAKNQRAFGSNLGPRNGGRIAPFGHYFRSAASTMVTSRQHRSLKFDRSMVKRVTKNLIGADLSHHLSVIWYSVTYANFGDFSAHFGGPWTPLAGVHYRVATGSPSTDPVPSDPVGTLTRWPGDPVTRFCIGELRSFMTLTGLVMQRVKD